MKLKKIVRELDGFTFVQYINPNINQTKENSYYFGKKLNNIRFDEKLKDLRKKMVSNYNLARKYDKDYKIRPSYVKNPIANSMLVQAIPSELSVKDYSLENWNWLAEAMLSKME